MQDNSIGKYNNWALIEVCEDGILYYELVYIHQFNSVWTIIFNFALIQNKLITPRIIESKYLSNNLMWKAFQKRMEGYLYLLHQFNIDLNYFLKTYSNIVNRAEIRVIDTFRYTISEEANQFIHYQLIQVL